MKTFDLISGEWVEAPGFDLDRGVWLSREDTGWRTIDGVHVHFDNKGHADKGPPALVESIESGRAGGGISSGSIPDSVQSRVKSAVDRIKQHNRSVEDARNLEKIVGGHGRYESEAREKHNTIEAEKTIGAFREQAANQGVDADAHLKAMGHENPHPESPAVKAWKEDQEGMKARDARTKSPSILPEITGASESQKKYGESSRSALLPELEARVAEYESAGHPQAGKARERLEKLRSDPISANWISASHQHADRVLGTNVGAQIGNPLTKPKGVSFNRHAYGVGTPLPLVQDKTPAGRSAGRHELVAGDHIAIRTTNGGESTGELVGEDEMGGLIIRPPGSAGDGYPIASHRISEIRLLPHPNPAVHVESLQAERSAAEADVEKARIRDRSAVSAVAKNQAYIARQRAESRLRIANAAIDVHNVRQPADGSVKLSQFNLETGVWLCGSDAACGCQAEDYDPDVDELPPEFLGPKFDLETGVWLSNCGTGKGGFSAGNTCGGKGYGKEHGIKTSRTTLGNIKATGATKGREYADKSGRKIVEHKAKDGRLFHEVTHANGRRAFHQVHGPAKPKATPEVKPEEPKVPQVDPETPVVPNPKIDPPRPHSALKLPKEPEPSVDDEISPEDVQEAQDRIKAISAYIHAADLSLDLKTGKWKVDPEKRKARIRAEAQAVRDRHASESKDDLDEFDKVTATNRGEWELGPQSPKTKRVKAKYSTPEGAGAKRYHMKSHRPGIRLSDIPDGGVVLSTMKLGNPVRIPGALENRETVDQEGNEIIWMWKDGIVEGEFEHPWQTMKDVFPGVTLGGDEPYRWSVDRDRMDHWATTFEKMKAAGCRVPVLKNHDYDKPLGTIEAMKRDGDRLRILHRFVGRDAALEAERNCSSIRFKNYKDGKNFFPDAIVENSLTPTPVIPGLGKFERVDSPLVLAN